MPGRGRFKDINQWPEPERTLWSRGLSAASRLQATGHAARWRPATKHSKNRGLGTFLHWLDLTGQLIAGETPGERTTPERIDAYRTYLSESVGEVTVGILLSGLERGLSVVAPGHDVTYLNKVIATYPKKGDPLKKRARMQNPAVLLQLGLDLMDESELQKRKNRHDAIRFRDGLMIGLLACRTPRLKNLTAIDVRRHLHVSDAGWSLEFQSSETKNHKHWLNSWPQILDQRLERYLAVYRPMLCGDYDGEALWISDRSQPLTDNGIYYAVTGRTKAAFGRSVNPHLFRDCAATSVAVHSPEHVAVGSHVLGNGFKTSQTYYNQAQCIEASQQLNDAMESRRRRSRKNCRRNHRR
ncbi:MAG: hypothetical protein WC026_06800 [Hyphomicrobium sp.]|uniref:hypothetical protein n=1 Tax=Hyphomicrobium sp. TaxID=82 RepID=UPI003569082A